MTSSGKNSTLDAVSNLTEDMSAVAGWMSSFGLNDAEVRQHAMLFVQNSGRLARSISRSDENHQSYRFNGTGEALDLKAITEESKKRYGDLGARKFPCTNVVIFHNASTVGHVRQLRNIVSAVMETVAKLEFPKDTNPVMDHKAFGDGSDQEVLNLLTRVEAVHPMYLRRNLNKPEIQMNTDTPEEEKVKVDDHQDQFEPDYVFTLFPLDRVPTCPNMTALLNEQRNGTKESEAWESLCKLASQLWPGRTPMACCLFLTHDYVLLGEEKQVIGQATKNWYARNNSASFAQTEFGSTESLLCSAVSTRMFVSDNPKDLKIEHRPPPGEFGSIPFIATDRKSSVPPMTAPSKPHWRMTYMPAFLNYLMALKPVEDCVFIEQHLYPSPLGMPCIQDELDMSSGTDSRQNLLLTAKPIKDISKFEWQKGASVGNTAEAETAFEAQVVASLQRQIVKVHGTWTRLITTRQASLDQSNRMYAPELPAHAPSMDELGRHESSLSRLVRAELLAVDPLQPYPTYTTARPVEWQKDKLNRFAFAATMSAEDAAATRLQASNTLSRDSIKTIVDRGNANDLRPTENPEDVD